MTEDEARRAKEREEAIDLAIKGAEALERVEVRFYDKTGAVVWRGKYEWAAPRFCIEVEWHQRPTHQRFYNQSLREFRTYDWPEHRPGEKVKLEVMTSHWATPMVPPLDF